MTDFKIIPYMAIDGIPTFTNSEIMGIYDQMVSEGTEKKVFLDGLVTSRETFLNEIQSQDTLNFIVTNDGVRCALARITHFRQYTAHCHVLKLGDFKGQDVVASAKFTMKKLMHLKIGNRYMVDVLYGLVPITNIPMLSLAKAMGMISIGIIPMAVYDYWESKSLDGVFMYCTRSECDENLQ